MRLQHEAWYGHFDVCFFRDVSILHCLCLTRVVRIALESLLSLLLDVTFKRPEATRQIGR